MSEEQNQEITSPEAPNNAELDKLKASVAALEKKNYDLIGKLQKNELIGEVPDDYEALKDFKRKAEQSKLESEGKKKLSEFLIKYERIDNSVAYAEVVEKYTGQNGIIWGIKKYKTI